MSFNRVMLENLASRLAGAVNGIYRIRKSGSWISVEVTFNKFHKDDYLHGSIRARAQGYDNTRKELENIYGRWRESPTGKKVLGLKDIDEQTQEIQEIEEELGNVKREGAYKKPRLGRDIDMDPIGSSNIQDTIFGKSKR